MVVMSFTVEGQDGSLLWFTDEDNCELAQLANTGPDMATLK
jgi:hypothetical protein